jgi:hypothetical protein
MNPRALYPVGRLVSLALLSTAVLVVAGCGGKSGPKNQVSGKVTLNGQPVVGTIKFSAGGKEKSGAILGNDGAYAVEDPPMGECDVTIEPMGGDMPGGIKAAPAVTGAGAVKEAGLVGAGQSQRPPDKYRKPGLLKFNVTGGKQTKDFELTP